MTSSNNLNLILIASILDIKYLININLVSLVYLFFYTLIDAEDKEFDEYQFGTSHSFIHLYLIPFTCIFIKRRKSQVPTMEMKNSKNSYLIH